MPVRLNQSQEIQQAVELFSIYLSTSVLKGNVVLDSRLHEELMYKHALFYGT